MPIRRNTLIANGFLRSAERSFDRKFDGVGLLNASVSTLEELQTIPKAIIYGTHSSWWDVMIAAFIARRTGLELFAPMDAEQLKKYWVLQYAGMFAASPEKALSFVRSVKEIFDRPGRSALFITPQAQFACNREEQPEFRRGLSTAIAAVPSVPVFAVTAQYEFWSESRPVALLGIRRVSTDVEPLNDNLRLSLNDQTKLVLSVASRRDEHEWQWLQRSAPRTTTVQDATNVVRSLATGEKIQAGHAR